jgi:hypothetical protein
MSTASEQILARYKERKTETDDFERAITVRPLRMSEQTAVMRLADSDSSTVQTVFMIAASVTEIDGDHITPPRSISDLHAIIDRLDQEGMNAATKAYMALNGSSDEGSGDAVSAAKNSPETPPSAKPAD